MLSLEAREGLENGKFSVCMREERGEKEEKREERERLRIRIRGEDGTLSLWGWK